MKQHELVVRAASYLLLVATAPVSATGCGLAHEKAYEAGFEDMPRRVPSLEKIFRQVGYRPTVDLDEILSRVVAHERAHGRLSLPATNRG